MSTNWEKIGFGFVVSIWCCALVFWPRQANRVSSPGSSKAPEGLYKSPLTNANFGLLGVHFYETKEGKKRWDIQSEFAELHRKENYAFMQRVTSDFHASRTGNVVRTISDYGRSLIDKNVVELEGNVSIQSKKGYHFTMQRLNYLGESHEFRSTDEVNMRGPQTQNPTMFLRGTGLVADIDREHFLLKKKVYARKRVRHSEWLQIQSREGEFFTDEQHAVFVGKVRSTLPPNLRIDSDILEIIQSDQRELLEARGNVLLKHKDRVGRAENAYLEIGGQKIVLEGKARVDSNKNEIRGRRIVMYTDDDRIEVEEAEGTMTNDALH